jgi:DNA-binding transcriptional LysR family regulator
MPYADPKLPDLAALALFLAVDDGGSVGAAARRYGITQSAASQRLTALERELGVRLLERGPSGSSLTPAGRVIGEWASSLVRAGRQFAHNVGSLAAGTTARLRVAASMTVADYLMPGWLNSLHALLPEVTVSLVPTNSERVAELVIAQEVSLGFVEGPGAPAGVRSRIVARDSLVVVVGATHPWASRRSPVTAQELSRAALVLREPESGTRQVLDRALAAKSLSATAAMELGSPTSIKQALAGGVNASVLSRLSVRDEVDAGTLVRVETPELDLRRDIRAIWRSGNSPTEAAGALLRLSLIT